MILTLHLKEVKARWGSGSPVREQVTAQETTSSGTKGGSGWNLGKISPWEMLGTVPHSLWKQWGHAQFYPAPFWRKRLKVKVWMRYSLPCLPHKLIAQFNKRTGGSSSE